jgi:hypothetical protein
VQRLGTILSQVKLAGPGPLQLRAIEAAVRAELGAKAAGVRVGGYRRGRLVLEVRSAARAFELQAFARGELLARLKRREGLAGLVDVSFKNGAWGSHGK